MCPKENKNVKIDGNNDILENNLNETIKSIKMVNEIKLEFIVCKLLKRSKMLLTLNEIKRDLFFIKDLDENYLKLILNYYDFIHEIGGKYYYSLKDKRVIDNISNIIYKIRYLETMEVHELIERLLIKKGKHLSFNEIKKNLNFIKYVNDLVLMNVLNNCDKFKVHGYKTWGLSSWDGYDEPYYRFRKDVIAFRNRKTSKISDRDWNVFKSYEIGVQKTTLQEIGDIYNITRERARQINEKIKRKLTHSTGKKKFQKYILFLERVIDEYSVLYLGHGEGYELYKEVFLDSHPVEIVKFLNLLGSDFVIENDKYLYQQNKLDRISNYLNYLIKNIKTYADKKTLNSIYKELGIKKWIEKELLKEVIEKDKRFYIKGNYCYYSKEIFNKYTLLYMIFQEIGEPVHYSIVVDEYIKHTGKNINSRLILSYFDRRKDLFIRVFTGIYGLRVWGHEEHIFVVDLVIELLEEKKCVMHYSDIYDFIKDKTMAKEKTVYGLIQSDERIGSYGAGFYGLASWIEHNYDLEYYSNIVQKHNQRRLGYLLGRFKNEYGYTVVKYRATDTILNGYTFKIPGILNVDLGEQVYLLDKEHRRYSCSFNANENNLYGVKSFFRSKKIEEDEILFLEFIASNTIRIFTKNEYENMYEVFDENKYDVYIETDEEEHHKDENNMIEVIDLESLKKFGLKYGYVYYEDIKMVDFSEEYRDIFDMMIDFNEKGITFLNRD